MSLERTRRSWRKPMTESLRKILQNYMFLIECKMATIFLWKCVIWTVIKNGTHESRLWFSFYWHKVCNDKYFSGITHCCWFTYKIQRIKTAAEWHSLSIDKRKFHSVLIAWQTNRFRGAVKAITADLRNEIVKFWFN